LPGVAYPGVRDNRSTINTKTGYDDDDDLLIENSIWHVVTPLIITSWTSKVLFLFVTSCSHQYVTWCCIVEVAGSRHWVPQHVNSCQISSDPLDVYCIDSRLWVNTVPLPVTSLLSKLLTLVNRPGKYTAVLVPVKLAVIFKVGYFRKSGKYGFRKILLFCLASR